MAAVCLAVGVASIPVAKRIFTALVTLPIVMPANVNLSAATYPESTNTQQPDNFPAVTIPVIGSVGRSTTVKIKAITTALAATVTTSIVGAPVVSADSSAPTTPQITSTSLGSQAQLTDGAVVQAWTISDLKPSSDSIPHQVNGTLWEATATDQAIQGSVTPIVSNINARAADGQTYRALFGAATAQGVNPSTIAQGQQTSGKVYFDVTGSTPNSVVYNAGGQDRAVWTQPAPSSTRTSTPSRSYGSGNYTAESPAAESAATPAAAAPAETPAAAPAAAGAPGAPLPEGSQGTPLPEGSQGTPLPEGSQGTPLPEGAPVAPPVEGAPMPASTQPAPQGSQGTSLEAVDQAPIPTTYTPAPTP